MIYSNTNKFLSFIPKINNSFKNKIDTMQNIYAGEEHLPIYQNVSLLGEGLSQTNRTWENYFGGTNNLPPVNLNDDITKKKN
jgi:hypothetical protein